MNAAADMIADVVPLLWCTGSFSDIQRKRGLESSSSLCSGSHAPVRTHAHTETPFVAARKRKFSAATHVCTMADTTSKPRLCIAVVHSAQKQAARITKT